MKAMNVCSILFLMTLSILFSTRLLAAYNPISLLQDTAITAYIDANVALDKNLASYNVNVSTNQGVVVLKGTLNTDKEALALLEIAADTNGVRNIDASNLTVKKNSQSLSDLMITAEVKALFYKQKLFDKETVNVETKNRIVYLTGTIKKYSQKNKAVNLAKSVAGVDRIETKVKIIHYNE